MKVESGAHIRTLRDPEGIVIDDGVRILRFTSEAVGVRLAENLSRPNIRKLVNNGSIVESIFLPKADSAELSSRFGLSAEYTVAIEHPRIHFPTYPYEWPAEMLWAAGQLTLEVALAAVADGLELKDATPFNILFKGSKPQFVDVLSFQHRDPKSLLWTAYAQYVRLFLLPLLADRSGYYSCDALATYPDGLDPGQLRAVLGWTRSFSHGSFSLAVLPAVLGRSGLGPHSSTRQFHARSEQNALNVITHTLQGLQRRTRKLQPNDRRKSNWSEYAREQPVSDLAIQSKSTFVEDQLRDSGRSVLDLGSNTGIYSIVAARLGAAVIAVDDDPISSGIAWRNAAAHSLPVTPVIMSLTDPTPGRGWRNGERSSFMERAKGAFDAVLALGLLHHLCAYERVPVSDVLSLLRDLTKHLLLVEFVPPEDPMFRRLLSGREVPLELASAASFEVALDHKFAVKSKLELPDSGRILYALQKRRDSVN